MSAYRAPDLIAAKRDGQQLDPDALRWLLERYLETVDTGQGAVSEGQMAAFLMAGLLRGFSEDEALVLTRVLVDSGETMDLSGLAEPTVDKHSTGGVGDSTTLLVAPLLASAGATVVKLAGRGLGHTGGTLDKLESVPGLRTDLPPEAVTAIAAQVGCVVAAQSARLVPADRALYALRDVTATVASPALIASSVMAKKLASGAGTIVLDVKAGDGAFLQTTEEATVLAALCVRIAVGAGRRCVALITAMDQPLGRAVGNALDVAECVELLQGAPVGRLAELALDLAAAGLARARGADPQARDDVRDELVARWQRGEALEVLQRMIAAQGGDPRVCERPREVLVSAPVVRDVPAGRSGYLAALPARAVGEAAMALGAGRTSADAAIDPAVGFELRAEVSDELDPDTVVARVHARSDAAAEQAADRLRELLIVGDQPVARPPTLLRVMS